MESGKSQTDRVILLKIICESGDAAARVTTAADSARAGAPAGPAKKCSGNARPFPLHFRAETV